MDPNRRLFELRNMMANYRHRRIHADEYADSRTLDLADEIVGDLEAVDRWLSDGRACARGVDRRRSIVIEVDSRTEGFV